MVTADHVILPDLIPEPALIRRRLAVVLTEANLLRAQLRVSEHLTREREACRRQRSKEVRLPDQPPPRPDQFVPDWTPSSKHSTLPTRHCTVPRSAATGRCRPGRDGHLEALGHPPCRRAGPGGPVTTAAAAQARQYRAEAVQLALSEILRPELESLAEGLVDLERRLP